MQCGVEDAALDIDIRCEYTFCTGVENSMMGLVDLYSAMNSGTGLCWTNVEQRPSPACSTKIK